MVENILYKRSSFSDAELKGIARLHERWISSGFLSSLGTGFLKRLYASIAECPGGVLIAAKDSNKKVVGFVSGARSIRSLYEHLISRHFLFLAILSLKFVFSFKTLKRILEAIKYSTHPGADNIPAELLYVVVDLRLRGTGISQDLFKQFREAIRQAGVDRFKIIVGAELIRAQKFYVKAGAVKTAEIELHQGELSFVYECAT